MLPINQDQHKVPQVYLRRFGYKNQNNQWMVSVLQKGKSYTQQKSIGSFTAETNVFDVDSTDARLTRLFEKLNCDYETEYNNILTELETNGSLSFKHYSYLLQIIANLICRSDYWRDFVVDMLKHKNKSNFLHILVGHHFKTPEEFMAIPEMEFFKLIMNLPPEEAANRVLLYFAGYLLHRLWNFEIVIILSQKDKPWFTTTNPVVLHNRIARREYMAKESELYFPLSPKYLVYVHCRLSNDKANRLRRLQHNKIYLANDKQNEKLTRIILNNPAEFLIIAGELKYRSQISPPSSILRKHSSLLALKLWKKISSKFKTRYACMSS